MMIYFSRYNNSYNVRTSRKYYFQSFTKFSDVWTCNISVKKKSSDYCFAKIRKGKPFPNDWDIIKKRGFCVGEDDGVIDINHRNFWHYYWIFFSIFSKHAMEIVEVQLFGKTWRIQTLKREPTWWEFNLRVMVKNVEW